jgi:hypothetical protein
MLERILDEDELYRRLPLISLNSDGTVNSAAFKLRGKPDPNISVDLARLTTPQESLNRVVNPNNFRLGAFLANTPRNLGLTVIHDPLNDNYAHSLIQDNENTQNSKVICRLLAESTKVIFPPDEVIAD